MGPTRFGSAGKLAFSFGNAAQDEGSAMAEYAISRGWKSADVVTDKLLVYFQNVCQGFTNRFEQLGGKIVKQESFTQGDKTINSVVSRVNGEKSNMVAFCTSFAGDQPAFVAGLRSARQQDADHEQLGRRRRLLVDEEPEGVELLLRHLRRRRRARTRTRRCARSRRR